VQPGIAGGPLEFAQPRGEVTQERGVGGIAGEVGDLVRVQDIKSKKWIDTGRIDKKLKRRRYAILLDDGRKIYRNRKFIRVRNDPNVESLPAGEGDVVDPTG